MSILFKKINNESIWLKPDVLYELRKDVIDEINEKNNQIMCQEPKSDVIPYSPDLNITTLVSKEKLIQLTGTAVSGKSLTFEIIMQPTKGSFVIVPGSNGQYVYTSNQRGTDFFTYVIHEGTMMSQLVRVNINNYSQADVVSISRNQGTVTFDNIKFDGDTWQFGTFTTDTFIQNGNYSRMGNFEFYNQNPV
jgi:hypothetical protein